MRFEPKFIGCAGIALVVSFFVIPAPGVAQGPLAGTRPRVEEAIEWGLSGDPSPYLLRHAGGVAPNPVIVGAIYTPYLRVALAAKAARAAGQAFTINDVSPELTEPTIYVAFRWYCCDHDRPDASSFNPFEPFDYQIARVPQTSHLPTDGELRSAVPPLWIRRDVSLLAGFGGRLPFDDVVLVAAYPVDALTADYDFVIYRQRPTSDSSTGQRSLGREIRIGRILRDELARWR